MSLVSQPEGEKVVVGYEAIEESQSENDFCTMHVSLEILMDDHPSLWVIL